MATATKIHTYKGVDIYPCSQTGIGRCNGRGWHIQSYHKPSGLPWAEGEGRPYGTLDEAKAAIDEESRYSAD